MERRAVSGTMAVAILLFGTRWVSYLGVPPLFLTDVLLLFAVCRYFADSYAYSNFNKPPRPAVGRPTLAILLAILLAVWAVVRFLVGVQHDLVAVRDMAPYLYAGLVLLAWAGVHRASDAARERTKRVMWLALVGHGVWVFLVMILAPNLPLALPVVAPVQELHVLGLRPDVDAALVGVLAALLLARLFQGRKNMLLTLAGFTAAWVVILLAGSRAGLIGAFAANAYVVLIALSERRASRNRSLGIVAILPLLLVFAVMILPITTTGTRLLATVGIQDASANAGSAVGTTEARDAAWRAMIDWTDETIPRMVLGAGMGANIMAESGAGIALVNSAEDDPTRPRSPHNFWIGTFARLGLLGALLAAFATLGHLGRSWRVREVIFGDEFMLTVVLVPLGLLIPATLGVVLESPFGAVPFWWCLGATLAMTPIHDIHAVRQPPAFALGDPGNSRDNLRG